LLIESHIIRERRTASFGSTARSCQKLQVTLNITPGKSLAPYRDCLGGKDTGTVICWGRGSFDRGDLKEAAGAAIRAMEPQA